MSSTPPSRRTAGASTSSATSSITSFRLLVLPCLLVCYPLSLPLHSVPHVVFSNPRHRFPQVFRVSYCAFPWAGVPSRQLELGLHRNDNFQTVFKRICSTDLVHDNYFYYGYIAGEYSNLCCPRYRETPTLAPRTSQWVRV